jgi:sRNA-binding regulator protein Hfq
MITDYSRGGDLSHGNVVPMPARKGDPALDETYKNVERPKIKQAMGHELPLASMIRNKESIEIVSINGDSYIGLVHSFDKFSVTMLGAQLIQVGGHKKVIPGHITIFKHSIEYFCRHDTGGAYR